MKKFRHLRKEIDESNVITRAIHRYSPLMKPKYMSAIRHYLNLRRKEPGQGRSLVTKAVKHVGLEPKDTDHVIHHLHNMIKNKKLPSHLAVESTDQWYKEQPEWGTKASSKKARKVTPGQQNEGSESWEAGYKRRVVKTTDADHKQKGYNWRIKGKDRPEISIKLYKEKPSQAEFNKQMKRVAGHEFGG